MQAVSISNVLSAKSPVSGAASLLSPAPQQWSPFAAILRAKLNAGNDAAKLPAGRAKDSARAEDFASNSLSISGAAPQLSVPAVNLAVTAAQPLPIPTKATIADSTVNHDPVAAIGSKHLPASVEAQSLSAVPSVRTNAPPVVNPFQLVDNIATLDSKLITQIADAPPNRNAPSKLAPTGKRGEQDGANTLG